LEIQGYHELEDLNRKNIRLNDLEIYIDRFLDFRFDELIRRCDMLKHLQTLEIFIFDPEILEMTKEFASLKHFTLGPSPYFKQWTISLDKFLIRQCPDRLESLCIQDAVVTASLDEAQVLQHFKTLKIEYGRVDDSVPEFLFQQCPCLLELVFSSIEFPFTCINLPSHNLDLLDIDYPSSKKLFVRVNLDGHVRLYCTAFSEGYSSRDDSMFYSGVKPVQPKNLSNERIVDVVSRSIRTIVLHNRLAV
jgi:hypothetical protein